MPKRKTTDRRNSVRGWRRRHVELPALIHADYQGATDHYGHGSSKLLAAAGIGFILALPEPARREIMERLWTMSNNPERAAEIEPPDVAAVVADALAEYGVRTQPPDPGLAQDRDEAVARDAETLRNLLTGTGRTSGHPPSGRDKDKKTG